MQAIISIILTFFMGFGIFLDAPINIGDENEFITFFSEHCEELREAYYEETGEEWNVQTFESYQEIFNTDDELYAYLISFNEGYITVTEENELLDMDTKINNPLFDSSKRTYFLGGSYYYKDGDDYIANSHSNFDNLSILGGEGIFSSDIYKDLYNFQKDNSFIIERSYSSDIKTKNGNYGNYKIITGYQGSTTDCGAQAALNYIYTYDLTNGTQIAKSNNWYKEIANIRSAMNWTYEGSKILGFDFYGIWPKDLMNGFKNYTDNKYTLVGVCDNLGLRIGLYGNLNLIETAHYALFVGQGKVKNWWIFYTYYDIISTWNQNFSDSGNRLTKFNNFIDNYYVVNHRDAIFYYNMKQV